MKKQSGGALQSKESIVTSPLPYPRISSGVAFTNQTEELNVAQEDSEVVDLQPASSSSSKEFQHNKDIQTDLQNTSNILTY